MSDDAPDFDEVTEDQRQFMRHYGLPAAMVAWATFEHLCVIADVNISPRMLRKTRSALIREMHQRGIGHPAQYDGSVVANVTRQSFELTMAEVLDRGTFYTKEEPH